jgi:hypothetical protein
MPALIAPQSPVLPVSPTESIAATGTQPGYLSRTVINALSTTWSTAAQVPRGNFLEFIGTGPGAGGASGHVLTNNGGGTNTASSGGGGAGGGARPPRLRVSRAFIIAQLPITYLCPIGGLLKAGSTVSGGSGSAVPGAGNAPLGPATMTGARGLLLYCGAGGRANGAPAGAGGGCWGSASGSNVAGAPIDAVTTASSTCSSFGGAVGNQRNTSGTGVQSLSRHGGAGGSPGATASTAIPVPGGPSQFGGAGGGHGGGCNNVAYTPQTPSVGSQGGGHDTIGWVAGGGLGGAVETDGQPGALGDDEAAGTGGGGGGGYKGTAAPRRGGAGGAGGYPGGGGGGGGTTHGSDSGSWTAASGGPGGGSEFVCLASN